MHLEWDDDGFCFWADRDQFEQLARAMRKALGKASGQQHAAGTPLAVWRHQVRADACGILAGPIAESLYDGSEFYIDDTGHSPSNDLDRALGLTQLLPSRETFERLGHMTEDALKTPGVWRRVTALAEELEHRGSMDYDDIIGFLPEPLPDWPSTTRRSARAALAALVE
ncbi:hypothetical protein CY652_18085 [Burkholderia sp. WAC0059]|nr:hypothetical protein CY652_18085 [Burkholderia sp. WAC0059]